jgi:hypothetical protein
MSARLESWANTPVHTLNIDWDGTAVPAMWPERPTEFLPGFVKAMKRLHKAGFRLQIWTARISPYDPWTSQRREPGIVAGEIFYIRDMLDRAGLTFVDIWVKEGKPGGSAYVDDKAERYNGCLKCWDKLTEKILVRLGKEEALFPAFDQGVTN